MLLTRFTPAHLADVHGLIADAGWPHRVEDVALALGVSEGSVALEDGTVVGAALCTPYGADDATINTVVVARALRGRGIGRTLTEAALAAAGARTCRLVATAQGRPLYETLGFVAVGEVTQRRGVLGARALGAGAPGGDAWAERAELDQIGALDRSATGIDRSALMAALFEVGRFAVVRRAGRVCAFACVRRFGRGFVTGPVVAEADADARGLVGAVFATHPGVFMRIDTPNAALIALLDEVGLAPTEAECAMRRGPERGRPDPSRYYALASQALG